MLLDADTVHVATDSKLLNENRFCRDGVLGTLPRGNLQFTLEYSLLCGSLLRVDGNSNVSESSGIAISDLCSSLMIGLK